MKWGVAAVAVAVVGLAIARPWTKKGDPLAGLTWGEVTRGDLEAVVSSTGSLEALDSVQVGSQVSGTIKEIRADFNDHVKKGQVLAIIDPSLLDAALRDSEAGVRKAKAQLDQAKADLGRQRELLSAGLIAQSDFLTFETALATAQASYESASAQLSRAQENRRYSVISSPIDGVVIQRAVDAGQTVAASFNTPQLFLLARDLSKMRILAEVDEGDIGQIRDGQSVRFTVAAYPDQTFEGRVSQIRLEPTVEQNVVKYTVVVETSNERGVLLPGMTATVDFLVETAKDVLNVPLAATRIVPNAAMEAELAKRRAERQASRAVGGGAEGSGGEGLAGPGGSGVNARGGAPGQLPTDLRRIWIRDAEGRLAARPVRLGVTDGRRVEIKLLFGELAPGTQVVTAVPAGRGAGATPQSGGGPRGFRVL